MTAQIGPYRDVLKESSVRGMLERKARLADATEPVSEHESEASRPAPDAATAPRDPGDHRRRHNRGWLGKRQQWAYLHRWADDGGSVRCRQ